MPLSDTLRAHMDRPPHYSPGLVSRLSGVPKATIVNWIDGRVTRPRRWQDVVRVADAMRLDHDETDDLLAAAGHASLIELGHLANEGDRALLDPWVRATTSEQSDSLLPTIATPFLGREGDQAAVSALVSDREVRVVTLTGIAGVGKTRLAIEVASDVAGRFRDGVAFVGLARLTDSEFVPDFIAQVLGAVGDTSAVRRVLASRHQLIVLDNFEHVLTAVPAIAELVAYAPDLTFLVTSRAVLHLYGEHQFEVAPLPVPGPENADFDEVAASPAVVLFTQRARAVDPSFQLGPTNVSVVAEICRRLDGLPLAIELAAARTAVLGLEGLLTRLAGRLGLLTWGARDLPARHQSLRATLDWSLAQLSDQAKRVFANVSVFMSGCRLDGAEAVVPLLEPDEVLDALMALADHSLVRALTVRGETRFVMLETVRSYAASLLTAEEARIAHEYALQYFVEIASAVEREARGARHVEWLDRADEEVDNIRAMLRWALDHDEVTSAAAIAASLLPFWLRRRPLPEGQRWLDQVLREKERLTPELLATTLYATGRIDRQRGDVTSAEQHLGEGLHVFESLADEPGRARALGGLGVVAYDRGDLQRSEELHRESLHIHRSHDDEVGMAMALTNLGEIARRRRQVHEAAALHRQSSSLFANAGDSIGEAAALTNLAAARLELGTWAEAHVALVQAAKLWQRAGERSDLAECLELFTALAVHRRQEERAVRLAAAAAALRKRAGAISSPTEADRHWADVVSLRQSVDATLFTAAWREGWAMDADEAVALALEEDLEPLLG